MTQPPHNPDIAAWEVEFFEQGLDELNMARNGAYGLREAIADLEISEFEATNAKFKRLAHDMGVLSCAKFYRTITDGSEAYHGFTRAQIADRSRLRFTTNKTIRMGDETYRHVRDVVMSFENDCVYDRSFAALAVARRDHAVEVCSDGLIPRESPAVISHDYRWGLLVGSDFMVPEPLIPTLRTPIATLQSTKQDMYRLYLSLQSIAKDGEQLDAYPEDEFDPLLPH